MSRFFDRLFGGQSTQDDSKTSTGLAHMGELINQTIWKGVWSENDRKNLSKIIEIVELYVSHSERGSLFDLLFVKGCGELELGLTSQAITSFDRLLEVNRRLWRASIT